jgi:hypothetical protein
MFNFISETLTVFGLASVNVDRHKANRVSVNQLKLMVSSVLTKTHAATMSSNSTILYMYVTFKTQLATQLYSLHFSHSLCVSV